MNENKRINKYILYIIFYICQLTVNDINLDKNLIDIKVTHCCTIHAVLYACTQSYFSSFALPACLQWHCSFHSFITSLNSAFVSPGLRPCILQDQFQTRGIFHSTERFLQYSLNLTSPLKAAGWTMASPLPTLTKCAFYLRGLGFFRVWIDYVGSGFLIGACVWLMAFFLKCFGGMSCSTMLSSWSALQYVEKECGKSGFVNIGAHLTVCIVPQQEFPLTYCHIF